MNTRLKILTFAIASISLSSTSVTAKSWSEEWFDSATYSGSSSYNNQQRGFASGGSFSGRLNLSNDKLVTIQPPKLSAGCGGIDGFMGGISFLDEDYLVQKFENILQAAPAVAFDMALKTMCKECSETITKLEAAVNYLNGIQLNECALTKKSVAVLNPSDPTVMSDVWTEITGQESLKKAMDRSWNEAQQTVRANNNAPTIDIKSRVAGCPVLIRNIFGGGHVLENATKDSGLENFSDLIRGYVGDVVVSSQPTDKVIRTAVIEPCPSNDPSDLKGILYGDAQIRKTDGVCQAESNSGGLLAQIQDYLEDISKKMVDGTQLSSAEQQFINNTPGVPVYMMLKTAIREGSLNETIDSVDEIVGTGYAFYIMDSLYNNTNNTFREMREALTNTAFDSESCNLDLYRPQIEQFKEIHARLNDTRIAFRDSYIVELNNFQTLTNQAAITQRANERVSKQNAMAIQ